MGPTRQRYFARSACMQAAFSRALSPPTCRIWSRSTKLAPSRTTPAVWELPARAPFTRPGKMAVRRRAAVTAMVPMRAEPPAHAQQARPPDAARLRMPVAPRRGAHHASPFHRNAGGHDASGRAARTMDYRRRPSRRARTISRRQYPSPSPRRGARVDERRTSRRYGCRPSRAGARTPDSHAKKRTRQGSRNSGSAIFRRSRHPGALRRLASRFPDHVAARSNAYALHCAQ